MLLFTQDNIHEVSHLLTLAKLPNCYSYLTTICHPLCTEDIERITLTKFFMKKLKIQVYFTTTLLSFFVFNS